MSRGGSDLGGGSEPGGGSEAGAAPSHGSTAAANASPSHGASAAAGASPSHGAASGGGRSQPGGHFGEGCVAAQGGGGANRSGHDGHAGHAGHGRHVAASRLRIVLVLASTYMVAEAVGGWWTNSLALLADAGHMFSDVAALAIALAAIRAASRAPTASHTYGFHRAEVLAALANAVGLCLVAAFICWEAFERFGSPPEVMGGAAFWIATGGLAVNLVGLAVLGDGQQHGIGVRSAWLHMLGDALGSVGAMVSSAAIVLFGAYWADPVASLLIAALIVRSASRLLLETVGVLMEGVPRHIDIEAVRRGLADLPGVIGVHDLHVWTITSGMDALSGHLVVADGVRPAAVLAAAQALLAERFGLGHVTLQVEEESLARCAD